MWNWERSLSEVKQRVEDQVVKYSIFSINLNLHWAIITAEVETRKYKRSYANAIICCILFAIKVVRSKFCAIFTQVIIY